MPRACGAGFPEPCPGSDSRCLPWLGRGCSPVPQWEMQQEQSRAQPMCVLRQPPSELSEESTAPRTCREFSQSLDLLYKYSAKTVLKHCQNFALCAEALCLSPGSSRAEGCFWAVRQDLSSLCDSWRWCWGEYWNCRAPPAREWWSIWLQGWWNAEPSLY